MISYLSAKVQKISALLFFFLFYLNFLGYAYIDRRSANYGHVITSSTISYREKAVVGYNWMNKGKASIIPKVSNIEMGNTENLLNLPQTNLKNKSLFSGGPGQPEMSSFKSVDVDNMVNLFTGDFSYNIPLLDAGGYPINIFYNAGVTMDQDASWVGLGWNINPGTISRNMRGLPDDFNGNTADADIITKTQSIKEDLTVGVNAGLNTEIKGTPLGIGANAGIFWNNRRGLGLEIGGDFSIQTSIAKKAGTEQTVKDTISNIKTSAGLNLNSQNGLSLNAGFDVTVHNNQKNISTGLSTAVDYNSRVGLSSLKIEAENTLYKKSESGKPYSLPSRLGSTISFARSSFTPGIRMPVSRYNGNLKIKLGSEIIVLHGNGYVAGSISRTYIADVDKIQKRPAYGYMYYEKANADKNAMLDFNRLNDATYTLKSPLISIPNYTYDIFTINGEGTGGSFRGYRGNMGFVRDNFTKSREGSMSLSFDAGGGNLFHGGTELGGVYSVTEVGDWVKSNALRNTIKFNETDSNYQSFYFKNPGEKAIIDEDYYNTVGSDLLIRPKLMSTNLPLPIAASKFESFDTTKKFFADLNLTSANTVKRKRDKRTQIITYLTAQEADKVSLDKIYSFTENEFKPGTCADPQMFYKTPISRYNQGDKQYYRKAHHISEIDVLEGDGKRYIYGIPAYTILQKEVTFSLDAWQGNPSTQTASYNSSQNSIKNKSGRDGFYQSDELPAYAHSFLLTAILSPDYVDKSGDGISDDDLGTAVKFNYTRVNKVGSNSWYTQKWRTPIEDSTAHYNQGLKTDNADDKGLYTYGEKELWYTHSIETKNMYVTFVLSERNDGKQVKNEKGGIDPNNGQRKLTRIDLYTKASFLKPNPKPIKTVHFAYSYSLCKGVKNNINATEGKLTLDSLWFSYNGNYKQTKNKYRFKYAEGRDGINANPDYNSTESDRWGTYKNHLSNPSLQVPMSNGDFPYTLQSNGDTLKNNVYASAWSLEKIMIPSGAVIKVNYEADDYAFVQNKRAAQMTKIAGFGKNSSSLPGNELYKYSSDPAKIANPGEMDYRFVFFDANEPVSSIAEINNKYLDGMKQLLMKIWVQMPTNSYGSGYEPVNVYATIKNYGLVPGNNNRFWVELNTTSKGGSPIMETVMQFLKDNLPSKAYKGYDNGTESAMRQIIFALNGLADGFFQAIVGFEVNLKAFSKCKLVNLDYSFARLNNPLYKKAGGGHRVKSIIISDNWKKMADPSNLNAAPQDSYYGQLYDYTTSETMNGISQLISSGVATYEPGIGNEENPFREVLQYRDKQPLGPTNVTNVELPITETFFPSSSVGYSKVTVRSIHNRSVKNIKSNTGQQVTEFYTSKDFPVLTDYTDFDSRSRVHYKPKGIMQILFQQKTDFLTLSQGFRVVMNDMNGKMKSQAAYGEYDMQSPINLTSYHYRIKNSTGSTYRLDNNLKVINGSNGIAETKLVGKDVEVMNDFRDHTATTRSSQIPLNVDAFSIPFIPGFISLLGLMRAFVKDENIYRSVTTLKIINEYGILDSVVNFDKGSEVSTKNIVYDGETGEVLVTRTNNNFNKPVYSLNYPAHWVNSGMDLAYKNIDLTYFNVNFINGKIENSPHVYQKNFESGDEIFILNPKRKIIANTTACNALGEPMVLFTSVETRIWALDIAKDERNTSHSFVFIDRNGMPYTGSGVNIRVIRSGKRNMGSVSVGSITSLNNPLKTINGIEKIDVTNTTDVLNAGTVEFKEKWRAQDGFYTVDSTILAKRYVPIQSLSIAANKSYAVNRYYGNCNNCGNDFSKYDNPGSFLARIHNTGKTRRLHEKETRSFLHFNLDSFDNSKVIKEAKLRLSPHMYMTKGNMGPIVSHDFIYNQDGWDGKHSNTNPHSSSSSMENAFVISRMLRPWPSHNSEGWGSRDNPNAFGEELNDYYSSVYSIGTPPLFSQNNYDVDILGLFRGLVRDKMNAGYTPGIKIRIAAKPSKDRDVRVCFWAPINNESSSYPTIDVKYYDCSNAYPIGYTPQPWEEVDSCIVPQTGRYCFSVFGRKQMNPYVQGVLGNWRAWRSYAYYGERRETNPAVATNITKDGVINEFENYWIPAENYLERTGSKKWVWNSEITQYNRKGLEIENHDPLERYNSGVYGYQETLPVAVANNARVREIAFDGFEDYSYKDEPCEPFCKPNKRHFNTGNISQNLDSSQYHTGKFSLRVPANGQVVFNSPVLPNDTTVTPDLRIKMNAVPFQDTVFNLTGTGLRGRYYSNTSFTGNYTERNPDLPLLTFKASKTNGRNCINEGTYSFLPPNNTCKDISVRWEGTVKTLETGVYYFNLGALGNIADDEAMLYINGIQYAWSRWAGQLITASPITLFKGTNYTIKIDFIQGTGMGLLQLKWRKGTIGQFSPVPVVNLYPAGITVPLPQYTTSYCYTLDSIQSIKHHLIDSFSLVANKRYVMSTWVKEGVSDCNCTDYLTNSIDITINGSTTLLPEGNAKPSGNIIEGWQRYEFEFIIPSNAQSLQVKLKNNGGQYAFFDDLRIHPFNANLKSFVYHPENLRLSAELDENNYASFYEYDDDGTLVRVKKETKDGIKTITETRSALQKSLPNF